MAFLSFLNTQSDITDITWRNHKRYAPLNAFSQQIMRGKSELSIAHRELIAAFVSALNNCEFCSGSHTIAAQHYGVTPGLIKKIIDNIDASNVTPRLKPILRYVKKLTLSPSQIDQSDVDAILAEEWAETTIEDVIAIVCLFNFYNRLLDGHGVKGSRSVYTQAGNHLAKHGYATPWFVKWITPWQKQSVITRFVGLNILHKSQQDNV